MTVFIDLVSSDYLAGAQLDFQENEMSRGLNNVDQEPRHAEIVVAAVLARTVNN
jgi:Fe-S cluster assembly iron-binding protein IscA